VSRGLAEARNDWSCAVVISNTWQPEAGTFATDQSRSVWRSRPRVLQLAKPEDGDRIAKLRIDSTISFGQFELLHDRPASPDLNRRLSHLQPVMNGNTSKATLFDEFQFWPHAASLERYVDVACDRRLSLTQHCATAQQRLSTHPEAQRHQAPSTPDALSNHLEVFPDSACIIGFRGEVKASAGVGRTGSSAATLIHSQRGSLYTGRRRRVHLPAYLSFRRPFSVSLCIAVGVLDKHRAAREGLSLTASETPNTFQSAPCIRRRF
jgi:hypothetical protein